MDSCVYVRQKPSHIDGNGFFNVIVNSLPTARAQTYQLTLACNKGGDRQK